jgi:hypothetical protein
MAPTSRSGGDEVGGGDKAATDIAISAAVVVSTLREESERLQCLAAAQMAIRESCAERLQTCPELRDDVRIADARKGAYEAAALRLQGIVEAVLGRGGGVAKARTEVSGAESSLHPLVAAALNERLPPTRRYDALVQLAHSKENIPADLQSLRNVYKRLTAVLPSFDSVLEVEPIRELTEIKAWAGQGCAGSSPETLAQLTQAALSAIESRAYPTNQQPLVEAAIVEIRRLGNDLAIRKMLAVVSPESGCRR